jgi:predicted esterase
LLNALKDTDDTHTALSLQPGIQFHKEISFTYAAVCTNSTALLYATALAQRMQLPQTACLSLSGPLEVPETDGGRAWFRAFDDNWELIQVHGFWASCFTKLLHFNSGCSSHHRQRQRACSLAPEHASLMALSSRYLWPTEVAWFYSHQFDDRPFVCMQPRPGEKRRLNSLASTLQLLQQQLLPALSAAGGWQPDQIQLLGFSQGGAVALELARHCKGSQRLGG